MIRIFLKKLLKRDHPTKQKVYHNLTPITKTIKVWRIRHVGHYWKSKDELISVILQWTPLHGRAKAGQLARTYIEQLCADTEYSLEDLQKRWTIETGSERGSEKSVLAAQHDDDDDDNDVDYVSSDNCVCNICINMWGIQNLGSDQ